MNFKSLKKYYRFGISAECGNLWKFRGPRSTTGSKRITEWSEDHRGFLLLGCGNRRYQPVPSRIAAGFRRASPVSGTLNRTGGSPELERSDVKVTGASRGKAHTVSGRTLLDCESRQRKLVGRYQGNRKK